MIEHARAGQSLDEVARRLMPARGGDAGRAQPARLRGEVARVGDLAREREQARGIDREVLGRALVLPDQRRRAAARRPRRPRRSHRAGRRVASATHVVRLRAGAFESACRSRVRAPLPTRADLARPSRAADATSRARLDDRRARAGCSSHTTALQLCVPRSTPTTKRTPPCYQAV